MYSRPTTSNTHWYIGIMDAWRVTCAYRARYLGTYLLFSGNVTIADGFFDSVYFLLVALAVSGGTFFGVAEGLFWGKGVFFIIFSNKKFFEFCFEKTNYTFRIIKNPPKA